MKILNKIINAVEKGIQLGLKIEGYDCNELINSLYEQLVGQRDAEISFLNISNYLESFYLNETYHVDTTFDKCIEWIYKNIKDINIYDDYIFIGWVFDSKNKKVYLSNEENNKLGIYPIYIRLIDNEYENIMSIVDRNESPLKILITINKSKKFNKIIDNKSCLSHEFRHCLTMYISAKNSIKDDISNIKENGANPFLYNAAKKLINLFTISEEEARLNATIYYLKHRSLNTSKDIKDLIKISDKHNLCSNMILSLHDIEYRISLGTVDYVVIAAYLFKKYGDPIYKKLNIDTNISIKSFNEIENKIEISKQLFNILNDNYINYIKHLQDAIYVHIIQK